MNIRKILEERASTFAAVSITLHTLMTDLSEVQCSWAHSESMSTL